MLTDVAGIEVGHWTDRAARTGCTVILAPQGVTASGEIRGGAPATRDFVLLEPTRQVSSVDAVVLSGGSAFGLAAVDGVMGWLEEQGRGFPTAGGPVPIVVGMGLYDLAVGRADVRPGPDEGRSAARDAAGGDVELGLVGAGVGCTIGKWKGRDHATDGGLGSATVSSGDLVVSALIAVNAVGSIDDGSTTGDPGPPHRQDPEVFGNTTIGVIATNAVADKVLCNLIAQGGHDGMARALTSAHTSGDGDGLVALATGHVDADPLHVRLLAQNAVTLAIRSVAAPTVHN